MIPIDDRKPNRQPLRTSPLSRDHGTCVLAFDKKAQTRDFSHSGPPQSHWSASLRDDGVRSASVRIDATRRSGQS